ncbi:MAG: hypothetical protein LBS61_02795 [Endomicrobium sp.]|nr:hypothetical protein [Endomicrobium sp.]
MQRTHRFRTFADIIHDAHPRYWHTIEEQQALAQTRAMGVDARFRGDA